MSYIHAKNYAHGHTWTCMYVFYECTYVIDPYCINGIKQLIMLIVYTYSRTYFIGTKCEMYIHTYVYSMLVNVILLLVSSVLFLFFNIKLSSFGSFLSNVLSCMKPIVTS